MILGAPIGKKYVTLQCVSFDNESLVSAKFGTVVFGNTALEYLQALGLFVVLVITFMVLQWIVLLRLEVLAKKTKTDIDDTIIRVWKSLRPSFYYFLAFYLALFLLEINDIVSQVINGILIAWVIYQVVIGLQILIDYIFERRARGIEGKDAKTAYGYLSRIIKWVLWFIALLLVLSNWGVNITSLVAGLGIGGIAIAFALQNILGDLFSSFAIYFDKPFEVGDFIIVGGHMGTVEKIGIKSTRIRALQGEEIVISNKELTSARVQNFKKLKERRVSFSFGVLYETPFEKVKKIPDMMNKIAESVSNIRLDRVHFKSFGDSSLDFEVVYYVLSGDYTEYMNIQQELNLKIMEMFQKEGINFAYPTQTVYLSKP